MQSRNQVLKEFFSNGDSDMGNCKLHRYCKWRLTAVSAYFKLNTQGKHVFGLKICP